MKTAQWILYNQLNHQYINSTADIVFCMQTKKSVIVTNTAAGVLSLNIYSKIIGYAASKHFVQTLGDRGFFLCVESRYSGIMDLCVREGVTHIIVMDAAEEYVRKTMRSLQGRLEKDGISMSILPNQQFLIDHETFRKQYEKPPVMETFYRWMRKTTGVLMDGDRPEGGDRNYDKHNRKFDRNFQDAERIVFDNDIVWDEACDRYKEDIQKWGKQATRHFPVTREESLGLLQHFLDVHLDRFGELEDAMYTSSDFVHHSLLSVPLNFGLLTPQEVIHAIALRDSAINNKEGCIRQILGRREYMYHRFTYYKDDIYTANFFKHTKKLPNWFWWPEESPCTMNCVQTVLERVDRTGYSHHIERLMIIGNFCLLVGYDPHHVNTWFWEQYADAFEWVVSPNVLGMSQYADGGGLATKPYVASANYVNKMSNYCKTCTYNPKEKYGETACPLNYLYRNFIEKHKDVFVQGRQSFIVNHLKKIDTDLIAQQSATFIQTLEGDE